MGEPWQHDLAAHVRRLRAERAVPLRVVAERSKLSVRALALLEAGDGNPTLSSLRALAAALEVDVSTLLQPAGARSVSLLGLRGAGKSSIGSLLAQRLSWPLVELDRAIERHAGMSLRSLFEMYGADHVRRLEAQALQEVLRGPQVVIATGGGIVTHPDSLTLLRRHTLTVWLKAAPQAHWDRVRAQGDERPMENRSAARAELDALWHARAPLYAGCEHTLDTESGPLASCAQRLYALVNGTADADVERRP
jgi:XRE family transcriptional regulator, aerobic/anaerobic benzoate catabolism transcriptional regulator